MMVNIRRNSGQLWLVVLWKMVGTDDDYYIGIVMFMIGVMVNINQY